MTPPLLNDSALAAAEVHLWYLRPDEFGDPQILAACDALLAPAERARRDRYAFAEHRLEYLLTRALVRTTLSRYARMAPSAWTFQSSEHGRPEVATTGYAWLRFNLSNTRGLIACAVVRDLDVGVDVEDTRRRSQAVELADRFFSPAEAAALRALPPEQQPSRFFDYWTLKEAYIKARGLGLAIPLAHFSLILTEEAGVSIRFGPEILDDPALWYFAQPHLTAQHRAALALRRRRARDPAPALLVRCVSPQDLAARAQPFKVPLLNAGGPRSSSAGTGGPPRPASSR